MSGLSINLFGITFKNPVWVASGTFGYGLEALELFDISRLGAVVTKGISLKPREGNEPPRIVETPCGMLNSIGLQNPGVESRGGMIFGHDVSLLGSLVERIRSRVKKPVLVKLSPNVTDITEYARVCVENGADGLVLINTLLGMRIDVRRGKPSLARGAGGLSGPAILPIAIRMVWQVYERFGSRVPIVGVGGITTWEEALEHVYAGASAVQIGTANFYDPLAPLKVIEGLAEFMKSEGVEDFSSLVGKAHR